MDGVDYSASETAIFRPTQHGLDWKSRCFFSKVISGPRGRVFKSHHSDQYKCPETVYSCGFRAFLFICGFRRFSVVTHIVTHTGFRGRFASSLENRLRAVMRGPHFTASRKTTLFLPSFAPTGVVGFFLLIPDICPEMPHVGVLSACAGFVPFPGFRRRFGRKSAFSSLKRNDLQFPAVRVRIRHGGDFPGIKQRRSRRRRYQHLRPAQR